MPQRKASQTSNKEQVGKNPVELLTRRNYDAEDLERNRWRLHPSEMTKGSCRNGHGCSILTCFLANVVVSRY